LKCSCEHILDVEPLHIVPYTLLKCMEHLFCLLCFQLPK